MVCARKELLQICKILTTKRTKPKPLEIPEKPYVEATKLWLPLQASSAPYLAMVSAKGKNHCLEHFRTHDKIDTQNQ